MMLINAMPRTVSNGFETFAPFYRNDGPRYQLIEMTKNEVNAWDTNGSVVQSQSNPGRWDTSFENCEDNKNLIRHLFDRNEESFETIPAYIQGRAGSRSRSVSMYESAHRTQQAFRSVPDPCPSFDSGCALLRTENQFQFGNNSLDCSLDTDWGYSNYSNIIDLSAAHPNRAGHSIIREISSLPQSSTSFFAPPLSASPGISDGFNSSRASPSTVYSSFSAMDPIPYDPMTDFFNSLAVRDDSSNGWCTDIGRSTSLAVQDTAEYVSCNGLPEIYNTWVPDEAAISQYGQYDQYDAPPGTVSPKALTLNTSNISYSSLGRGPEITSSADVIATTNHSLPAYSGVAEDVSNRPRRKLPTQPLTLPTVPVVPTESQMRLEKEYNHSSRPTHQVRSGKHDIQESRRYSTRTFSDAQPSTPKRNVPKSKQEEHAPPKTIASQATSSSSTKSSVQAVPQHRDPKDDFLVKSKLAGMSYKDIRRKGGFTEAESTLRGRFRTLTKTKDERVRRPIWKDNDIRLLKKAVRKLTHGTDSQKAKVPWKKVAEYIYRHGGSYRFGNATCRKRWDELQGLSGS